MIDLNNKKIIFLGCGAVGKTTLYFLENFFKVNPKNIYLIDLLDYKEHPTIKEYIQKGSKYIISDVNKNYKTIFNKLKEYDIIIDVTARTNSIKLYEYARQKNLHYINTSLEDDKSLKQMKNEQEFKLTYQYAHNKIKDINLEYDEKNKASCVIEFGMNPGLISIFAKLGILFLADNVRKTKQLKQYIKNREYNKICKYLEVDIIHCSETDTTEFLNKKGSSKFCNTWCCSGLIDEYSHHCEFGWGSHEKTKPKGSELLNNNIIDLNEPAYNVYCESYVPTDEKFIGCVIPHGEGLSLTEFLRDSEYSPTVHYVYKFSPITQKSIKKLPKKYLGGTIPQNKTHVLNNLDDKIIGLDTVGALIISKYGSVWSGSILDNSETPYYQGTTQQVAIGILSALSFLVENKNLGGLYPENIDEKYIFNKIKNNMGIIYVDWVNYKPKSTQFNDLRKTKEQFDSQFN